MNRNEILKKTKNIFHNIFDLKDITVTEETNANDIEDWDSLSHINLISACELEFSIKFGINDIFKLKTVGNFIDLIEGYLNK